MAGLSGRSITMMHLFHRFCQGTASRIRNLVYRELGVDFRDYCWLRDVEISRNWSDITLHGCSLDRGVVLLCSGPPHAAMIEIGHGAYINRYTILDAHQSIRIGRDVMIGPHCYITDGNHGVKAGLSVKCQPMTSAPVVLEDGVWIGAHVTILPGVTIGHGAVIGAGSVVTKSIAPDTIAFGSPAVVRSQRPSPSN
jgi:acetyltransferase-like isoleucine patch superfamily enzyme